MRSLASFVSALSLCLSIASGCSVPSLEGPRTPGDRGRTAWLIADGLCGGGLLGGECALSQALAVGASPRVVVHERDGVSLEGATLVADGGSVSGARSDTDDEGHTTLSADVSSDAAGTIELRVIDAGGSEIDRARVTFVEAARITCGELGTSVLRELDFPGLRAGETVRPVAGSSGARTTTLACRADDASGAPLLTVDAIRWTVVGDTEGVTIASDALFPVPPARGATARLTVTATEPGTATVRAELDGLTAEIAVAF